MESKYSHCGSCPVDAVPELDEPHQLRRADRRGSGWRWRSTSTRLSCSWAKKVRTLGPALPRQGQVVVLQGRGVAAVGDGVEVQGEGLGLGEQQRRQGRDPAGQQAAVAGRARCGRSSRWRSVFLGRTFRPANRPRASSKLKSLMWLRRSLSSSFRASRLSSAACGGDHARAGIAGLADQVGRSGGGPAGAGRGRSPRRASSSATDRRRTRRATRRSATAGVSARGPGDPRRCPGGTSQLPLSKKGERIAGVVGSVVGTHRPTAGGCCNGSRSGRRRPSASARRGTRRGAPRSGGDADGSAGRKTPGMECGP